MAVGQQVEVEVEQGPGLIRDEFELTDARGRTYGAADPLVEYVFVDSRNVSFRIPPGIATGPARVTLGVDGKEGQYTLKLTIFRLSVLLDANGWLTAVDVDTGETKNSFLLGHGASSVRLSRDGSRILATASADHAVHFLHLGGGGVEPYAPSVQGIGTRPVDVVFMSSGALVATEQGLAVVRQHQNGSTVLEAFLDTGPVNMLAGSAEHGRVVALALATADGTDTADYVHVVEFVGDDPVLSGDPFRLDPASLSGWPQGDFQNWTVGAVASPVLSADGRSLFLSNRSDNQIVMVNASDGAYAAHVNLPSDENNRCTDPIRFAINRDERWMVVACGGSASAAIYEVDIATPSMEHRNTVALGATPWDVGFSRGDLAYLLLANGVVLLDLADPVAVEPEPLGWDAAQGALAIAVQP